MGFQPTFTSTGELIPDFFHYLPRVFIHPNGSCLLAGGFNPFEKYARQIGFIFPKIVGVKIKNI